MNERPGDNPSPRPSRSPSQQWRCSDRLTKSSEFDAALKTRPRRTRHFQVFTLRREPDTQSRLGMIISRKVGNAVQRNRLRRRIREAFRTHRHQFPYPVDLVVRALPGSALLTAHECSREILQGLVPPAGHGAQPGQENER